MAAKKVALLGDSTTNTRYLASVKNPLLVSGFGKPANWDGTIAGRLQQELGSEYDVGNFAYDGRTAYQAVTESLSFIANRPPSSGAVILNCPVTYTGTMWNAAKSWNPDIVVLSFGINGAGTFDDFKSSIDTMVNDCVALGIEVVAWNGPWCKYGPNDEGDGMSHNTSFADSFAYLSDKVSSAGGCVANTQDRFKAEQQAGNWDLFGHNDGSMYSVWTGATDTASLYRNVHQWIAGNELIVSEVAETILYGTGDIDIIFDEIAEDGDLDIIFDEIAENVVVDAVASVGVSAAVGSNAVKVVSRTASVSSAATVSAANKQHVIEAVASVVLYANVIASRASSKYVGRVVAKSTQVRDEVRPRTKQKRVINR